MIKKKFKNEEIYHQDCNFSYLYIKKLVEIDFFFGLIRIIKMNT